MGKNEGLKQCAAAGFVCLAAVLLISCNMSLSVMDEKTDSQETVLVEEKAGEVSTLHPDGVQNSTNQLETLLEANPQHLRLAVVGDLMVHGPQIRAQQEADGSYDFHNNFEYIKPWLQSSDVVVGNLETTFAGPERGYSSFPRFNTPDAFGEALLEAGFHGVSTVNNHTIDTGSQGFFRTLTVLDDLGIKRIGTRINENEEFWQLFTHDGIVIGITAVSYETPRAYGRRTLNALLIPEELEGLINSFDYNTWETDLMPVKAQLLAMKEAGAEMTAVMVHWGEEYQLRQNQWQEKIANDLAAAGADLILGSHPHVLQPVRPIQRESEGPTSWVVYSMGNFISNQRYEILKRHEPEDGAVLFVDIIKDPVHGSVAIKNVSYQPTWVHRYWKNDRLIYEILPLPEALQQPDKYNLLSSDSLVRAQSSLDRTAGQWYNLPMSQLPVTEP